MKTIFVKPINNHVVRHPDTFARIADEGETVAYNSYWTRRASEDSISISDEAPKEAIQPLAKQDIKDSAIKE